MSSTSNTKKLYEGMNPDYEKKGKRVTKSLMANPISRSTGAGALSPEAAEQLGDKAKELRKKKLSSVSLPSLKKEEFVSEEEMTEKLSDSVFGQLLSGVVKKKNIFGGYILYRF